MYPQLKLDHQLCFPLYVASKEIIKKYKPYLDEINLTYTSYIVMLVMWELGEINVSNLGEKLWLDSGTLTPLLKKMERQGLLKRIRYEKDERIVVIKLTNEGKDLEEIAKEIPFKLAACLEISEKEITMLHNILHKLMSK